jgi:polysaccharide biosynthesis transport protein
MVLAVTSSLPSEGKTVTAVNCATVLAQQGANVLLVDADFRHPSLHEAFGIPQDPGLSGIVAGDCAEQHARVRVDAIPNLVMLPSGMPPEYPAELLASPKMMELIDGWRSEYDHVVIDTPPVSMFTDAVVLASRADAVLLVARASITPKHALRHAGDVLRRANVNLAGVVLNGADLRQQNGYYRSYAAGKARRGIASAVWFMVIILAALEQIIQERQRKRERQKVNAAITSYYDSLTVEERQENWLWGEFSEEQIAATHFPEPQS